MPKLRKMLGDARHPTVLSLMRLMETQSHKTLVRWATDCVRTRYLPLTEDARLCAALAAAGGWLKGELSLKAAQAPLREARQAAGAETEPVRQAAARAIATACAAIQTPTSALGFVFYGAAAAAYHQAGLNASKEVYDALADAELEALLSALQETAVADEPCPALLDWGCGGGEA